MTTWTTQTHVEWMWFDPRLIPRRGNSTSELRRPVHGGYPNITGTKADDEADR